MLGILNLNGSLIKTVISPQIDSSIMNLEDGSHTITDLTEIANTFNNCFANVGPSLAVHIKSDASSSVFDVRENACNTSMLLYSTTADEVEELIESLKVSAAGYDDIPAKIFETFNSIIVKPIFHLINFSFKLGQFPQALKEAIVTPILKGKSKLNTANYRPVSVLLVLSKILEIKKKTV